MAKIRILSEQLANKIAAGEVIERPASIVKELVENSLDAGAKKIEVSYRHGGRSLIRVSDDGFGMEASDLELAFARHATSKITKDEDLESIESYGFRGEALPSIAAVSRITMTSRQASRDSGTEIVIEGGKVVSVKPTACAVGTTAEVKDLFFNTPARRKFMKSESSESGQISDTFTHLSLARLDVHFVLLQDEEILWNLPAGQSLLERVRDLWGVETAAQLISLDSSGSEIRISGVIGKPLASRGNRSNQLFYVNHRWIKTPALSFALQAGYHGRLMQGRFPVAVLFLEINPTEVDVNVHPTKQEVKMSQERQIKSILQEAVARAFESRSDLAPMSAGIESSSSRTVDMLHEVSSTYEAFSHLQPRFESAPSFERPLTAETPEFQKFQPAISTPDGTPVTKILGQIHHTFLVAETAGGILLVDQHAAHERVNFEVLLAQFQSKKPSRQRLLMDEILELTAREAEAVTSSLDFLNRTGFDLEPFGKNNFVIRALPSLLGSQNPVALIRQFLEQKLEGTVRTSLENAEEDIAALISCKRKSYKAHDPLSPQEIEKLIALLFQCKNPFGCPHGRPSFIHWTFLDLEKQFKRRV